MQTSAPRIATALLATLTLALLAPWGAAQAQFGNLLNQGGSNSGSAQNALGNLGGLGSSLSPSSLSSSSLGNVTGVLQYCIKNNYLNADAASNVKDSLLPQPDTDRHCKAFHSTARDEGAPDVPGVVVVKVVEVRQLLSHAAPSAPGSFLRQVTPYSHLPADDEQRRWCASR